MSAVTATAAVVVAWALASAVLFGCGYAVRRGVVAVLGIGASRTPCVGDVWSGLCALLVALTLWSCVAPIGWLTWIGPVVLAGVGFWLASRARVDREWVPSAALLAVGGVLVVLLGNASLGSPTAYDSGLYHFAAIDWATDGAAQPGLGNLHVRLSSSASHLLLVAALGVGPWVEAGHHLANGLVVSLLLVHVVAVLGSRDAAARHAFSWRLALLALPAIVIVVGADASERLSSPSLDSPVFALVLAAGIASAQAVERSFDPRYLLAGGCCLAAALGTRLHLVPAIVVLAALVLVLARARTDRLALTSLIALPAAAMLVGVTARQTILSGYPLFPLEMPWIPVDWRLPAQQVDAYRDAVAAWARQPGSISPNTSARDWVGPWLGRTVGDIDVAAALAVLACLPLLAVLALRSRSGSRERLRAAAVVLVPAAVSVVVWFLAAPDPRFALGWVWLVALGGVAWLLPSAGGSKVSSRSLACLVAALWFGAGAALTVSRELPIAHVDGAGPFGTSRPPIPPVRAFTTKSGLVVMTPVRGDRCWRAELCTPMPSARLRLRGSAQEDGFATTGS